MEYKMEGLFLMNKQLENNDCLCEPDTKDAYFPVHLHKESQKYVRFQWGRKMNQFVCMFLRLGFSLAPSFSIKLMKVTLSMLKRHYILLIL